MGDVPPQSRLADKEAAEGRAASLEADNHELAARLVEMKSTEIQRMHETNRICEQMVRCWNSPTQLGSLQCGYDGVLDAHASVQTCAGLSHPPTWFVSQTGHVNSAEGGCMFRWRSPHAEVRQP